MNTKQTLVKPNEPIINVIREITDAPKRGGMAGMAVVIDAKNKVLGVLTDGDIRKAVYNKVDLNGPVQNIMSKQPVMVEDGLGLDETIKRAHRKIRERNIDISKVVLIKKSGEFVDIMSLPNLYLAADVSHKVVAVYGLGFVGLTLALTLAENKMFDVVGIDTNQDVLERLQQGQASFYEKGLSSLLHQVTEQKSIRFIDTKAEAGADVHIISVGTPVVDQKPQMKFIEQVTQHISKIIKKGDLVICRSTVPVGTMRRHVVPALEKGSGLKAGQDFHVAFAPERTVAGNALKELRVLPQIVGGLTPQCAKLCASVFKKITNTIVSVATLEEAEIVKLINNTYRDLVFSFANEVAYMCDQYNVDAASVIQAANEGYPRNPIPTPSPGVGGTCLSKDPHLYGFHDQKGSFAKINLGKMSRAVNDRGVEYVMWQYDKFLKQNQLDAKRMPVLVVGVAFKGLPETTDCRNSPGVDLIEALKKRGCEVRAFDAVLRHEEIEAYADVTTDMMSGFAQSQAIFFMNNHPNNTKLELFEALRTLKGPGLIFDGFSQINKAEVESVDGVTYASMGYMSI